MAAPWTVAQARLLCPRDSKVVAFEQFLFPLQMIFPILGLNVGLLYYRQILFAN